ncbi:aldehyde dehydrogenase family protein [Polymorphum gilvum]|uniref:Phenylacetaldehyde dehydrogenase (PAD) n=1 Tax=Polymorphum gilvum (strain LMG 25793 / CGMCC 1.9160 / SL003B-26A1) TaxID=991905 RepID=F2IXH3_POLGS|nr:aldehyde dehydrogenase family protein [Polymorphum gilvum]ADZ71596.1 Phenylacetaldehyde dehydrogenase (PAD) [Polymorphum gilvum SL003B-26A1]
MLNVPSDLHPATHSFLAREHGHFIDGKSQRGEGASIDVFDPATGLVIAKVPDATEQEVDRAVKAARAALGGEWSKMRPADREKVLVRLADLIEANGEELAQIETMNQGKSIMISRMLEAGHSSEFTRYMAGWATKIEGSTLDVSIGFPPGVQYRAMTLREPVGVVGAIVPWNFPLVMAVWKIAPALACGCTVVLKPAEETPLTALRLAELCLEAGVPAGVVNVITGYGHTAGASLVAHPGVDKVAFTGSTEVGRKIGEAALKNMTRFSLELGGKSPMIVLDDFDPAMAAQGAAAGIFFNNGQVCTASSRLYVHKKIFDNVVSDLAGAAAQMKVGPGMDPANQINPLVSRRQQERVKGYIAQGLADGARAATGGPDSDGDGFFVRPTILVDTNHAMSVVREEIFGPVMVAMPFDDLDEALAKANDTVYGLGASVWSNDYSKIMRAVGAIKAGTVWVNTHNAVDANMPFGGFKHSGMGREMGRAAIDLYTETKSVCFAY